MHTAYVPHRSRLDIASRDKKVKKIVAVLADYVDLKESNLLDIGTSAGHIAHRLSQQAGSVTSVDIFDERIIKTGYKFVKAKDAHLPLENNTFDVVVSNQVIEHIPDQQLHINEIERVLKRGGIAYLSTPNKYWLIEPHYKLPFLSWLPSGLSVRYLQIAKGKEWNIYPQSYENLLNLTYGKFTLHNKTLEIIKSPEKYNLDILEKMQPVLKKLPMAVLHKFNKMLPAYVVILRKS